MTRGPAPPTRFEGAVLTGGRSSRMGRDKALVPVAGVAMAARVAGVLREAGAVAVRCVGGDLAGLARLGLAAVPDPHQGAGPLGGLVAALGAAGSEVVVVCACDLPLLDASTVRSLVSALDGGADVAMARGGRGREPLVAAWRTDRARSVLAAAFEAGERAVHRAVGGLTVVEVALDDDRVLRNVNTPGDLP